MSTPASTEAIQTYAHNASRTKNLMSPGSLSFPTDHNKLTPHGNASLKAPEKGASAGSPLVKGNGMAPVTPAATPDAQQTGSGLTPTLQ
jgi:transcription initiation factor TFIID TATA-box-binding protein